MTNGPAFTDTRLRSPARAEVELTADGSRTIRIAGETFHSASGAWSEARDVFLHNSGIASRLENGQDCRILEIGFGAGLNLLVTADCALKHPPARLHYTGVDNRILDPELVAELAWETLFDHSPLAAQWLAMMRELAQAGTSRREFCLCDKVQLEVLPGDATCVNFGNQLYDAVYHDPFRPEVSPELWQLEFLQQLFRILQPQGTLVSYCVKSSVQRSLTAAGFAVSTVRGPAGGKREVLVARRTG